MGTIIALRQHFNLVEHVVVLALQITMVVIMVTDIVELLHLADLFIRLNVSLVLMHIVVVEQLLGHLGVRAVA
jgi:uncharacterized membrane protein